jgi:hypothetical protein
MKRFAALPRHITPWLLWLLIGNALCVCAVVGLASFPRDRGWNDVAASHYDPAAGVEWVSMQNSWFETSFVLNRLIPPERFSPWKQVPYDGVLAKRAASDLSTERALPESVIGLADFTESTSDHYRRVIVWGWPWPLASCTVRFTDEGFRTRGAFSSLGPPGNRFPSGTIVPYRLQWLNLLPTGAAVGGALWSLTTGLRWTISTIRRRQSKCAACGYPATGTPCPECGQHPGATPASV